MEGGAPSPFYQTHTSYWETTCRGKKKLKVQLMGNTTDSLFSVFHVFPSPPLPRLPFITKLPSPPPCPQATGAVSTKLRLGMWPPDENQLAQRAARMKRTPPISVSIITGPIYSENRLIAWLLVPCYPQYAPAEWSFAMRTCH